MLFVLLSVLFLLATSPTTHAVELIDASEYAVARESRLDSSLQGELKAFKLLGGAAVDVNPRAGNTGDELLLLHTLSNNSATIFSVVSDPGSWHAKITQTASATFARPLRCLSDDQAGSCVLAARRAPIPTIGDANPPSPPGPPPDLCASKCVAPCGTAESGAAGAWLASVNNVLDPCECCKRCCAKPACKAWQLCTGPTCASNLHTCWLKSTPEMGKNAASTSGLRPTAAIAEAAGYPLKSDDDAVLSNQRGRLDSDGQPMITGEANNMFHDGAWYLYFNDWGACPGVDCCGSEGRGGGDPGVCASCCFKKPPHPYITGCKIGRAHV